MKWAIENSFTMVEGKVGDRHCGCLIGALVMMKYPEALADAKEYAVDSYRPLHVYRDAVYFAASGFTGIIAGFDDSPFNNRFIKSFYDYGKKVRELYFNLVKKG